MRLRDILVCLDATDAGEGRLQLAAGIAREHEAHLSAAYVAPEAIPGAPPYDGLAAVPPTGAAWLPKSDPDADVATPPSGIGPSSGAELAAIVEQRFREEVQPHAIEGDWHLFASGEGADFVALATTADLVVFGQAAPDFRLPTGFRPEDIVVSSGRPVLVVPYAGTFTAVGRHVLVAWDGTREAARALHDSLPLIGKAEAVTLMTVRGRETNSERDRVSLERLARHLGRHGVAARAEEAVQGDIPISDVLLSRASDLDIDLIVAGAYHHSQLREALIGGVSRELLDHMTVPVLMSH